MKRFTSIFAFILTVALCISAFSACDAGLKRKTPTEETYFNFVLLEDGTYSISAKDPKNLPANVVLPAEYNGAPVTTIANSAFEESAIESVYIQNTYTNIEAYAFVRCSQLKTVEFAPNKKVEKIGAGAFSYCVNLKGIEFCSALKSIGARAFIGCTSLNSVFVTANVSEIGEQAFEGCTCNIDVSESNPYFKSVNNEIVAK